MSNLAASLTIKLHALGEAKLAAVVAQLDKMAVAAAVDGSRLKGVQREVEKLAAGAPKLRSLEQEMVRLGNKAEQARITNAAKEILAGPTGTPPVIAKLKSVEHEYARLERQLENKKITDLARERLNPSRGLLGGLLAGHGFLSTPRQVLGLMRDVAVAAPAMARVVGGAFRSLTEPVKQFEASMADIRNKGGFDAAAMADIADAAKRVTSTRGLEQFAPTQAAAAGVELAAAGLSAQGVKTAMPTVLRFAQGGGLDTGASATLLSDTMAQFKKTPEDMEHLGDVMVKAANMSTIAVSHIGDSLKYVGPIANTAGMQFEQLTGMIALLGSRGVKGSEAGTALRKVITSLAHPTRQAREAMGALGLTRKDMQQGLEDLPGFLAKLQSRMGAKKMGTAQRVEMAKLLFGQEGMTAADILMKSATTLGDDGVNEIDKFTNALRASNGEMAKAAEIAGNTLGGAFAKVHAKMEALLLTVGGKLAPAIERLIDKIAPMIDKVSAFLGQSEGAVDVAGGALMTAAGLALTPGKGAVLSLAGRAATGVVGAAGTSAVGAGLSAATGIVPTIVAIAQIAIPAILAGAAGFVLGKVVANAMGGEKIGSTLYDLVNGTHDSKLSDYENDPELKALREKERAKQARMKAEADAAAAAQHTEGEIKVIVEDNRTRVQTVSRSGAPLRTGANVQ